MVMDTDLLLRCIQWNLIFPFSSLKNPWDRSLSESGTLPSFYGDIRNFGAILKQYTFVPCIAFALLFQGFFSYSPMKSWHALFKDKSRCSFKGVICSALRFLKNNFLNVKYMDSNKILKVQKHLILHKSYHPPLPPAGRHPFFLSLIKFCAYKRYRLHSCIPCSFPTMSLL